MKNKITKKKEKKINKEKIFEHFYVNKTINNIEISFVYKTTKDRLCINKNYLNNIIKTYLKRKYSIDIKYTDYITLKKILECFNKKYHAEIKKEFSYIIYDECLEIKELVFARKFFSGIRDSLYILLSNTLL